jgi:CO/xanthine dehydrogenase FAD-binding subunit
VKAGAFRYERAGSLEDAIGMLARHGAGATLIALFRR